MRTCLICHGNYIRWSKKHSHHCTVLLDSAIPKHEPARGNPLFKNLHWFLITATLKPQIHTIAYKSYTVLFLCIIPKSSFTTLIPSAADFVSLPFQIKAYHQTFALVFSLPKIFSHPLLFLHTAGLLKSPRYNIRLPPQRGLSSPIKSWLL